MNVIAFLNLAEQYSNLGSAVLEQLHDVAQGAPIHEQDAKAMREAGKLLLALSRYDVEGAADLAQQIKDELNPK